MLVGTYPKIEKCFKNYDSRKTECVNKTISATDVFQLLEYRFYRTVENTKHAASIPYTNYRSK